MPTVAPPKILSRWDLQTANDAVTVQYADHPIAFADFVEYALNLSTGKEQWLELADGVITEKPMVQMTHGFLEAWLISVVGLYVRERDLGITAHSRILVKTGENGGRLPDFLFVRKERVAEIVYLKFIDGAPDLIIEIVSPNDRPSYLIGLESEYRRSAVREIVFIDTAHRTVRTVRLSDDKTYRDETITDGVLRLETVEDIELDIEWLFDEARPSALKTVQALLAKRETESPQS